VTFLSRSNWHYRLERATDLAHWNPVSPWTPGTGGPLGLLESDSAGGTMAFYRVNAQRP
jgi:hypothetical protein